MCLSIFETWISISESIALIIAIGVGGLWAVKLFCSKREKYPKAKLSHKITPIPIDQNNILLRITLIIENQGEVLLTLSSVSMRILQINPWPKDFKAKIKKGGQIVADNKTQYEWPYIEDKTIGLEDVEIEPNENENIPFDFILSRNNKSIEVYTFVKNKMKKGIGWHLTTFYQLKGGKNGKKMEQMSKVALPAKASDPSLKKVSKSRTRKGVEKKQAPIKPKPKPAKPLKKK